MPTKCILGHIPQMYIKKMALINQRRQRQQGCQTTLVDSHAKLKGTVMVNVCGVTFSGLQCIVFPCATRSPFSKRTWSESEHHSSAELSDPSN